jgi:hypothetical protein
MGLGKSISTDERTSAYHVKRAQIRVTFAQCQYGTCPLQELGVPGASQGGVYFCKFSADHGNPDGCFQYWICLLVDWFQTIEQWNRTFETLYQFRKRNP